MCMGVNGEEDRPVWIWSKNGKYNVKSMYNLLANQGPVRSFHHLWLIWHNAIATKDNMFRRKCRGDITYRFCPNNETIHHLFFTCDAAKYTSWGGRASTSLLPSWLNLLIVKLRVLAMYAATLINTLVHNDIIHL